MGLNELSNPLGAVTNAIGTIQPTTAAVVSGAAGLAVGGVAGAGIMALASRKKTKRRKKKTSRKNKRIRKKKYHSSRRRKHTGRTSHRRIHYTKNNQPYVILPSGKARFIKKRSAKRSRRLKGGYY
jgi:hypothetical protein